MSDIEFIDGLIVKAPHPKAPEYVKAAISIQPAKLAEWLAMHQGEEWVNVQVKESRGGKWYASVDTWKPDADRKPCAPAGGAPHASAPPPADNDGFEDDDIPF
jgi:hypothetical protein